jgi:recombination DNA repair RAD52 pathway protein
MAITFFSQGIISARNNHHRNQILVYFDIRWDSPKITEASAVDTAISVPVRQVHNQVKALHASFPKLRNKKKHSMLLSYIRTMVQSNVIIT